MSRIARFILLIALFLSSVVIVLRYGAGPIASIMGIKDRAGLRIVSQPLAQVKIDGQLLGQTPFQTEQFEVGDHLISLETISEGGAKVQKWQGYVPLNTGTVTVVNRELSVNEATASGEVIALKSGKGVSIVSTPTGADVNLDGKPVGKTPLLLIDVVSGDHTFVLSHNNYLNRSVQAATVDNFQLILRVDLALSEADLTKVNTEPLQSSPQVVIKNTPTGFLRVRANATASSAEIGLVKPGETVSLLEEAAGWYRVRLTDGKEGYISATYATKK